MGTLWIPVGILLALLLGAVAAIYKVWQERRLPETTGVIVGYYERLNESVMQYYPDVQLVQPDGNLATVVRVDRPINKLPRIGTQVTVRHQPDGKLLISSEGLGAPATIAIACLIMMLFVIGVTVAVATTY